MGLKPTEDVLGLPDDEFQQDLYGVEAVYQP